VSKAINIISSTAVPLNIENVDTDQIIPARFLKATSRDGFGKNLFRDWRYENDDESKPRKDFALNNPVYKGRILVAAKNFTFALKMTCAVISPKGRQISIAPSVR